MFLTGIARRRLSYLARKITTQRLSPATEIPFSLIMNLEPQEEHHPSPNFNPENYPDVRFEALNEDTPPNEQVFRS